MTPEASSIWIQHAGRAGRDCWPLRATLLVKPLKKHVYPEMQQWVLTNDSLFEGQTANATQLLRAGRYTRGSFWHPSWLDPQLLTGSPSMMCLGTRPRPSLPPSGRPGPGRWSGSLQHPHLRRLQSDSPVGPVVSLWYSCARSIGLGCCHGSWPV